LNLTLGFAIIKGINTFNKILPYFKPFFKGFPQATSLWPIFLILGTVILNNYALNLKDDFFSSEKSKIFNYGESLRNSQSKLGLLAYASAETLATDLKKSSLFLIDGALIGSSYPSSNLISFRGDVKKYTRAGGVCRKHLGGH